MEQPLSGLQALQQRGTELPGSQPLTADVAEPQSILLALLFATKNQTFPLKYETLAMAK